MRQLGFFTTRRSTPGCSKQGASNHGSLSPARRVKRSVFAFLLAITGALSACTLFPKNAPMQVYQLPEPSAAPATAPALEHSLRISTPQANKTLSSTRVLVVPQAQQISAYGDARWSDTAPTLLRDYLISAFRQRAQFSAVIDENSRVRGDVELVSNLRAFQSEYRDRDPEAVIQLEAQLVRGNNRQIIASQRFEVRAPSESTDVNAVIHAFGQATEQLSEALFSWSLENQKGLSR